MMQKALVVAALLSLPCIATAAGGRPSPPPNIVFILADDLGYGDVHGLNAARGKIPTPGLDRLAARGMVFTDAHSGSSVCTPTRYGILTGRYAWRTRLQHGVMQDNQPPLIASDRLTVPSLLRTNGYATACIGKWHLGYTYAGGGKAASRGKRSEPGPSIGTRIPDGPLTRGFDCFYGFHHAGSMQTLVQDDRVVAKIRPVEMLPRLTERAESYILGRGTNSQPFFLYLALNSPHAPIVPSKEWQGRSGLGAYGDYVMQTDASVARVLDAIEKAGIESNTQVLFASDNGCSPVAGVKQLEKRGHFPSAGFRGYKSDIWDGGHRIPLIVRWPDRIRAGASSDQLVCLGDLMATCADLLCVPLPQNAGEDSYSFLPALTGGACARDAIVHHSIKGAFAIRQGAWKLELCEGSGGWSQGGDHDAPGQLYDMTKDPAERTNQYASHPEVVARLGRLLETYVADGRSTPGAPQKNDVPVDLRKRQATVMDGGE